MGRVPALRAESIFYWIRQEKRKRRDALAKLESKMITQSKIDMQKIVDDERMFDLGKFWEFYNI